MKREIKTIVSNHSFGTTVSLLSIGGYYVEGYLENPNLANYKLFIRVSGNSSGLVGMIQRENVTITLNSNNSSNHDYESDILASLDYSYEPKITPPKAKRKLNNDISKIPEWK
ncbi:MAG: hypothetical protein WC867_00045 [Candidatus Pacearchaeota archaeon]|jgi:hypothetical protein